MKPINMEIMSAGKLLDDSDRELLCKPVEPEEIKAADAVWDVDSMKAPGPDGYSSGFCNKASSWDIVL